MANSSLPQAPDGNQTKTGSRPVSYYDNYLENGNTLDRSIAKSTSAPPRNQEATTKENDDSMTQTHCLNTTVPQNIAAQNIAGKHAPTRNSLRHSRMIVMNRSGRVPKKYLPAIIRYHRLAKALLGLIILFGAAICFLALWLLLWTPNIKSRDNPYWSGVPVLISGILGLILMCCCRKEYPGMKGSFCVYGFKVVSILTSGVAAGVALTACAFALIHLISLSSMTCLPTDNLNTTCACSLGPEKNATMMPIKKYHYVDLSCPEVNNILNILLIFSVATNGFAGALEFWYVYLHWASRYSYVYSKVRTNEQMMTVFSNSNNNS